MEHERQGKLAELYKSTFEKRQESLIDKCKAFSKENNRVFVIAGSAHTIFEEEYSKPEFKEGVGILRSYLDTKKAVIFDNFNTPALTFGLEADVKICRFMHSFEKSVRKVCRCAPRFFLFLAILFTFPVSLPCYLLNSSYRNDLLWLVEKCNSLRLRYFSRG